MIDFEAMRKQKHSQLFQNRKNLDLRKSLKKSKSAKMVSFEEI